MLPNLVQSARMTPACSRIATRCSILDLVHCSELLVEALATVSAIFDVGDAPVIPSSPSFVQSTRKNPSYTPVPSNPPPVLVFSTPENLQRTVLAVDAIRA